MLREEFFNALHEYLDELRDSGLDVVRSTLAVKNTLADVPSWLREQSMTWCIEHYYRIR